MRKWQGTEEIEWVRAVACIRSLIGVTPILGSGLETFVTGIRPHIYATTIIR